MTAAFISRILNVPEKWVQPLALDQWHDVEGAQVALVDANHCPGAVQLLFRLRDGRRFVHTGDMRYCTAFQGHPMLRDMAGCDCLYLDTTYCRPKHTFPPQEDSIAYVVDVARKELAAEGQQEAPGEPSAPQKGRWRTLILVATYGIGKERILTALRASLGHRIYARDDKLAKMAALGLPELAPAELFTDDAAATPVHVVPWGLPGETWPYFRPNFAGLEEYRERMGAERVVGIVPTGWTYEMKRSPFSHRDKGPGCSVHLVPYSEHSSFDELREYVRFLRPSKARNGGRVLVRCCWVDRLVHPSAAGGPNGWRAGPEEPGGHAAPLCPAHGPD